MKRYALVVLKIVSLYQNMCMTYSIGCTLRYLIQRPPVHRGVWHEKRPRLPGTLRSLCDAAVQYCPPETLVCWFSLNFKTHVQACTCSKLRCSMQCNVVSLDVLCNVMYHRQQNVQLFCYADDKLSCSIF